MAFRGSLFVFAFALLFATKAYGILPPLKPPCEDHASSPAPSTPADAMSPPTMAPMSTPPSSAPVTSPSSAPVVYPTPQAPPPQTPTPPSSAPMTSPSSPPSVYPKPQGPAISPATAPMVPGVPSTHHSHLRYCVPECQTRCTMLRDQYKILRKIRACVHVCTACCDKNKPLCVPTSQMTCPVWDSVVYHGGLRQCP